MEKRDSQGNTVLHYAAGAFFSMSVFSVRTVITHDQVPLSAKPKQCSWDAQLELLPYMQAMDGERLLSFYCLRALTWCVLVVVLVRLSSAVRAAYSVSLLRLLSDVALGCLRLEKLMPTIFHMP